MLSTIAVDSGKWYAEAKADTHSSVTLVGIIENEQWTTEASGYHITGDQSLSFAYANDGRLVNAGDTPSWGSTYTTGDIIGVYLDLDNSKLYFAKNGTIQNSGTGISLTSGKLYHIAITNRTSDFTSLNFGNPISSISSGNTDANGYGNFEYDPSDGGSASFDSTAKDFYALNSKNLAEFG